MSKIINLKTLNLVNRDRDSTSQMVPNKPLKVIVNIELQACSRVLLSFWKKFLFVLAKASIDRTFLLWKNLKHTFIASNCVQERV